MMPGSDKPVTQTEMGQLFGVYIEHIDTRFDAILEYVQQIPGLKSDIARLSQGIVDVKTEQHTVRISSVEASRDI